MIGIDANVLIACELTIHPQHRAVHLLLDGEVKQGESFALCPQVLSEFIHIVTDSKRLSDPLTMPEALQQAELWSSASDVSMLLPGSQALNLFYRWMNVHDLGRKRVLDTLMAATYASGGVTKLATLNPKDFEVFGTFELVAV